VGDQGVPHPLLVLWRKATYEIREDRWKDGLSGLRTYVD
jgi:hypothetical protein